MTRKEFEAYQHNQKMSVELQDVQFYACLEESVSEYSSQINQFNIKDNLLALRGQPTGSNFSHKRISPTLNETIKLVSDDINRFSFNRCIAHFYSLINVLSNHKDNTEKGKQCYNYALNQFAIIFSPFSPHISEELWQKTGGTGLVSDTKWPVHNEKWLVKDHITIAIQINGKLRSTIKKAFDQDVNKEKTIKYMQNLTKLSTILSLSYKLET